MQVKFIIFSLVTGAINWMTNVWGGTGRRRPATGVEEDRWRTRILWDEVESKECGATVTFNSLGMRCQCNSRHTVLSDKNTRNISHEEN
jgi:hypothetical protein